MASMLRAKWKKWDILDTAIEREGWKLLLLLRLSPMVPYNLLNIAMATTKMHFLTFSVVSLFGASPLPVRDILAETVLLVTRTATCNLLWSSPRCRSLASSWRPSLLHPHYLLIVAVLQAPSCSR